MAEANIAQKEEGQIRLKLVGKRSLSPIGIGFWWILLYQNWIWVKLRLTSRAMTKALKTHFSHAFVRLMRFPAWIYSTI